MEVSVDGRALLCVISHNVAVLMSTHSMVNGKILVLGMCVAHPPLCISCCYSVLALRVFFVVSGAILGVGRSSLPYSVLVSVRRFFCLDASWSVD